MTRESKGVHLDSIITVVDCINFCGYEVPLQLTSLIQDNSYTAKLQARYTDVILMNKHQLVKEQEYEQCLDHVYTLNDDTPVIKTYMKEDVAVDPDLVFGLDTRLFDELNDKHMIDGYVDSHHSRELDLIHLESEAENSFTRERIEEILQMCSKNEIYRIKGFIKIEGEGMYILNWAFERWEMTPLRRNLQQKEKGLRLTVMLAKGEGRQWQKEFLNRFQGHSVYVLDAW